MQNEADLLDTDLLPIRTAEEIPPAVCEAAPMAYAVVICFASCIGSSRVLELSTNDRFDLSGLGVQRYQRNLSLRDRFVRWPSKAEEQEIKQFLGF
jgi:hypothetical protein